MGNWLSRLWMSLKSARSGDNGEKAKANPVREKDEGPFTPWYTYGDHMYRRAGELAEVMFTNPKTGKKKLMVNNNGKILNFPGIEKEDFWMKEISNNRYLDPVIRFRTEFLKYDHERFIMLWQVQPDGRYWADDDGFGWENDSEVQLYSFIDQNGDFMGPFRIYAIDARKYLKE